MSNVVLGHPENYTIGGLRFYFNRDVSGQTPIAITGVSIANKTFTVDGDYAFELGYGGRFTISGSTGNDGDYHSVGAVYDSGADETTVTVKEIPADATAGGDITVTRLGELYLGNVVTGEIAPDITYLDHFTAKSGTRKKDRSIVQEIMVPINLTLDEPNVDAMNYFMLGGAIAAGTYPTGLTPQVFQPYTDLDKKGGCRLAGVSDSGNEWVWEIPRCSFKPDGAFSYNDQDWSQFSFIVEVLDASDESATKPYGDLYHFGVDENIDVEIPLPDNG
jgi:hypothetical protein